MTTRQEHILGRRANSYDIGWTIPEIELLVKLIDDEEDLTDAEEDELHGIRQKLIKKRKNLRQRARRIEDGKIRL